MKLKHLYITILFLTCFLLLSDRLIELKPLFNSTFWGLFDNFVHGVAAVIILLPLIRKPYLSQTIFIYLIASLLDADHFFVIGKVSFPEAAALQMRPATHSITFALLIALTIPSVISKLNKTKFNLALSWILFSAISSHVIRDAFSGVTPILYPLHIYRIPYWFYLILEISLLSISFLLSRIASTKPNSPTHHLRSNNSKLQNQ